MINKEQTQFGTRTTTTRDEVIKSVLNSQSVTTLPTVATKVITLSSKEDTSVKDIADLLSKDASLSAKVLKIANSAFYSFPVKISTVLQAVSRIGINAIRSLVLSFSFLTIQTNNKTNAFNYEKFLEKSLASAVAAKLIMSEINKNYSEEIFTAALLQNIGELILANTFPKQYEQVITNKANDGNDDSIELEQQVIGADHTLIGYEITKRWSFPDELIVPIRYHHFPEQYEGQDKKLKLFANVVHLSGLVVNIFYFNEPVEPCIYHKKFSEKSEEMLGFNEEIIECILKQVDSEIEKIAEIFGFKIEKPKPIEDLLIDANNALSALNMTYVQLNKEHIEAKLQLQKLNKELEERNQQLENLANIDGLTEVYNHRFFQVFLDRELNNALKTECVVSLIFFDIDHFKKFNDSYGHPVGDHILKQMCQLVKKHLRTCDIIARYGGEEFAIILNETKKEKAQIIAERMRSTIEQYLFIIDGKQFNVTASFGVAEITPFIDNCTKENLIYFADTALLESKKRGRNRVTSYNL
ncbi:MAG: GGDEF domain-containing protein [Planctomycetes bacterium]|nr:GGDEF domain-containing protein [Planctomycetota bacterium]